MRKASIIQQKGNGMKRMFILVLICLLCGCSYESGRLKTWVSDPHFAQYQKNLDNLEQSYLQGKLTYPEYLKQKQEIEDTYAKEVKEREGKIHQE